MTWCNGPECEPWWFHSAINPKAKPEGSWFFDSCQLGRVSNVGKRMSGGGTKVVQVIAVGARRKEACWDRRRGKELV